jgi:hypothetical protein
VKITLASGTALALAIILCSALLSQAQDAPMGDVARAAREQKSQAPRAAKVVTDEELGPQAGPVNQTDDPADVVNRASRSLQANIAHTCRQELTNNSGPGSRVEKTTQIAGPDRARIIIDRKGLDTAHIELIAIGTDLYHREGAGPWDKYPANGGPSSPVSLNQLPEALNNTYARGEFTLVRREAINGSATFMYESKYHPGGVPGRDRTIDVWVGADDGLPREVEMTTSERTASFIAPTVDRDTTTCTYGPMAEIKPPI